MISNNFTNIILPILPIEFKNKHTIWIGKNNNINKNIFENYINLLKTNNDISCNQIENVIYIQYMTLIHFFCCIIVIIENKDEKIILFERIYGNIISFMDFTTKSIKLLNNYSINLNEIIQLNNTNELIENQVDLNEINPDEINDETEKIINTILSGYNIDFYIDKQKE